MNSRHMSILKMYFVADHAVSLPAGPKEENLGTIMFCNNFFDKAPPLASKPTASYYMHKILDH